MTDREQAKAFEGDLRALINRYRSEFNITYPVAIGILQLAIMELYQETLEDGEDDQPPRSDWCSTGD